MLNLKGSIGVVRPGAVADLLLVAGDPVQDIGVLARPEDALMLVIKEGKLSKIADSHMSDAGAARSISLAAISSHPSAGVSADEPVFIPEMSAPDDDANATANVVVQTDRCVCRIADLQEAGFDIDAVVKIQVDLYQFLW